ncbi:hypothetical protein FM104_09350 [Microbacterium esteraromaticum]|uniref:Uncharacterized protein n=1 Tax=Microbacterium esteraromaticum TaxID=57043 RepID=A0A1R4JXB3_9MICO|nr:hypothetical protein FM104_09350 [Microbacterium esteraromaticum]
MGTREWLTANNGEVVPASVVSEITDAGGGPAAGAWWVGESGADGNFLSDAAIDWIEEAANGEH